MSWDPPEQVGDDVAMLAERRKVIVRWRETPGGVPVGIVHACQGTWWPLTYSWSTLTNFTYCGIDLVERVSAANRKTLWAANVSFIEAVECEDCKAAWAARRLEQSNA